MSFQFFWEVLKELGKKLQYDAIVNYAGNSFCSDSWDMIDSANPFNTSDNKMTKKQQSTLLGLLERPDRIGKVVIEKDKGNDGSEGKQN